MAIKIAGIDHIVLRTTRLDEMLAFYRDLLGCAVERELPPEVGLVQLRAGTALIDIVTVDSELGRMGGGPPTDTENNLDHFCLQIEPVEEAELSAYLSGKGVEVGEFAERYGAEGFGNSIYIKDPEGNVVELRNRLGD
jgi:catechol 2,3-dioxygenase-like lactoylglutathione lyase family enzyme